MSKPKGHKYYVVWQGLDTGVFDSWEECRELVTGVPGARYKAFNTHEAALKAYRNDPLESGDVLQAIVSHARREVVNYEAIPEIDITALAVDAACAGNPGVMEYRGVMVATGTEVFHQGPWPGGTNNIGEYLAIVHALAWLHRHDDGRTIYSDSRTGISWVRKRRCGTTLPRTEANKALFDVIDRADRWLQAHAPVNRIAKWDTEKWGEIPADFGRK